MKRREALAATAALFGTAIVGAEVLLEACSPRERSRGLVFGADDIRLLDEVGETIIPETVQSPGARAAQIGEFMKVIVTDCYNELEQEIFMKGIASLTERSLQEYNNSFVAMSKEDKFRLLVALDEEAGNIAKEGKEGVHYFTMLKQLTIWGYFSSEPGATIALRYVPIPGRYEGCVDYVKGEGAWVY